MKRRQSQPKESNSIQCSRSPRRLRSFQNWRDNPRRGAIMVMMLFLLPALLILIGMAIDISQVQLHRAELRLAVDSASRAAADELARTESSTRALQKAIQVARLNEVGGRPLELRPQDVLFGNSEPNSSGRWLFRPGRTPFNSVQITGLRNNERSGGQIPLTFGRILGQNGIDSRMASVASFRSVDIVLVLDRSTSMKLDVISYERGMYTNDPRFCSPPRRSSRWAALDSAVQVFIQELNSTDAEERVALVTFGDDIPSYMCGRLRPATLDETLTSNMGRINGRMSSWSNGVWNGNTNIAAGIDQGVAALLDNSNGRRLAEKVMFVLTDGQATNNMTLPAARRAASQGIKLSTITFSVDADQSLMRQVAAIGNGIQLHANTSSELISVFRELAAQTAIVTN